MLFKHSFHPGIRDGSITLTFRTWKAAKVQPGSSYRFGPDAALEVTSVESVKVDSITQAAAKRSGFAIRDDLLDALKLHSKTRLTVRSRVFRVAFRLAEAADPRAALREDTSAAALDEVAARLERMDCLSRKGPWTQGMLQLIAKNSQVSASKLAPTQGRETKPFKADVRKLKGLGLTISHGVGYSLSPRGKALLKRLAKKR